MTRQKLEFAAWEPDAARLDGQAAHEAKNVLPAKRGYVPMPSWVRSPLPNVARRPRAAWTRRLENGTSLTVVATDNGIYSLENGAWVSKYTSAQGMLPEARDDGVRDYMTDDGAIVRSQDVTEIVRQNQFLQGEDRFRGFRKAPDFHRVASIPVAVVDIAYAHGLDILNNQDHLRLFLNDPENRAFRTTLERV